MPEQKNKDFVRIPVSDEAGKHSNENIRGKTISKKEGISSLYCVECEKITTFLFAKASGWTMSKARAWMKGHLSEGFFSLSDDGKAIFEVYNKNGKKVDSKLVPLMEADDNEVENLMNKERTIFMFGGIHDGTAQEVCKRLLAYDKMDNTKPITLVIGSYGGGIYQNHPGGSLLQGL